MAWAADGEVGLQRGRFSTVLNRKMQARHQHVTRADAVPDHLLAVPGTGKTGGRRVVALGDSWLGVEMYG